MTNSIDLPLGVGVIVIKDGKVLTGTRTDNGLICGPGGHIHAGEKVEDAAARETEEEFSIKVNKLYQLGAICDPEGKWKPSMVFLCTDYEGEPKTDDGEMKDARFISMDELSQMSNLFPCFAASLVLLMDKLGIKSGDESELNTDARPGEWITVNGRHVQVGENGEIDYGNDESSTDMEIRLTAMGYKLSDKKRNDLNGKPFKNKTVELPKDEYVRVIEEIDADYKRVYKNSKTGYHESFDMKYGHKMYVFENRGHNDFNIYDVWEIDT